MVHVRHGAGKCSQRHVSDAHAHLPDGTGRQHHSGWVNIHSHISRGSDLTDFRRLGFRLNWTPAIDCYWQRGRDIWFCGGAAGPNLAVDVSGVMCASIPLCPGWAKFWGFYRGEFHHGEPRQSVWNYRHNLPDHRRDRPTRRRITGRSIWV